MKKIVYTTLFLLTVTLLSAYAQNGFIRGTVIDDKIGETLPFSTISLKGTSKVTTSDLDGAYSLEVQPGTYSLIVSFVGYQPLEVQDVVVTAGKVNELNLRLKEDTEMLEEVVVTARMVRNSEAAIRTMQKKSPNLLDGISSQAFSKIGDNDAGAAIQRVPGLSVEGGKYVFVRGLGDRYTKTLLNGLDVPGLDPDRNTIQMDLFPTNLIDNIVVLKTFTPNLPGDFTGGVVDISTKDFPVEKTFNVKVGASYNPSMSFNSNGLTSPGSNTDFLGFDNNTRNNPLYRNSNIPSTIQRNSLLTQMTEAYNPNLAAQRYTTPANLNFSLSTGNQIKKTKATIGYNATLNYQNQTEHYDEAIYGIYRKMAPNTSNNNELELDRSSVGALTKNSVILSGLVGGAIKFKKHKYRVTAMHIQNGESSAGYFEQNTFLRNSNQIFRDNVEYSQRSITNALIGGKHSLQDGKLEIDWRLSPTISRIEDKDVRVTPFRFDEGRFSIEPSEGAEPLRIFRDLTEYNYSGKVDIDKKYQLKGKDAKLSVGLGNVYKIRDYEILQYRLKVIGQNQLEINGNADALLSPENIWNPETKIGTYIAGNYEPANTFTASQNIASAYIMNENYIGEKLKAVYGVRAEKFDLLYTGQSNLGDVVYDNEKFIDDLNILPSLNLVYELNENTNIRAAATRTVARPSFKEASIAQIYDALTDRFFIGNRDLKSTNISNFDVRFEKYSEGGQMISVSGFYKDFTNPIEVVAFSQATPNNFQPRNVGRASVIGAEIELIRNLDTFIPALKGFNIGSNVTFVRSQVEMTEDEFLSRQENKRDNEAVDRFRPLQGQSPFIVNAFLNYANAKNGIDGNLSYNIQGKRLAVVGIGRNPDVYEIPFNALNAKVSKAFGESKRAKVSVSAQNILNSVRQKQYQSFEAAPQVFELLRPGRQYGVSFSYGL
ncbi:MAG: TonB-dependent receptor [Spirosomaceae bacterium]|nr:TonB-dependent receptor [Spirosomataceae bacterium]